MTSPEVAHDGPEVDLQPWALRTFQRAYERQDRREKCSRGDFYAGFRAALIELKVWSFFKDGAGEANL